MRNRIDWTTMKSLIDGGGLRTKGLDFAGAHWIYAYDWPWSAECVIQQESPASSDQSDYETNYEATINQPQGIEIKEEATLTGGHYQAQGYVMVIPATSGWQSLDISFPHPVSLMAAEWNNDSGFATDEVELQVAPDTTTGAITQAVAVNDTVINVASTVTANAQIGYFVKLDDGTNSDDLGCITAIDATAGTITVSTAAANAFAVATPSLIKQTIKMVPAMELDGYGRVVLGEAKIGGSYLPANTTLRARYNNVTATAKRFRFVMEYLY